MGSSSQSHADTTKQKQAVFAGGCFWCMEPPFDKLDGVVSTKSGFAGGETKDPSYKDVTAGGTGHLEVIEVIYDPEKVTYQTLLETYWANVDPVDDGGQFCDRGDSYKTAIFYADDAQKTLAEQSKTLLQDKMDTPVVTPLRALDAFYPAEDYHQDYYQKKSRLYKFYRWRCGRDDRLEELWGDHAGKAIKLFD